MLIVIPLWIIVRSYSMRRGAALFAEERLVCTDLVTLRERARIGTRAYGYARGWRKRDRRRIIHAAAALARACPRVAGHQAGGVGLELGKGRRQGRRRRERGDGHPLLRMRTGHGGDREANDKPQAQRILPITMRQTRYPSPPVLVQLSIRSRQLEYGPCVR
jgi:hypothetical protein